MHTLVNVVKGIVSVKITEFVMEQDFSDRTTITSQIIWQGVADCHAIHSVDPDGEICKDSYNGVGLEVADKWKLELAILDTHVQLSNVVSPYDAYIDRQSLQLIHNSLGYVLPLQRTVQQIIHNSCCQWLVMYCSIKNVTLTLVGVKYPDTENVTNAHTRVVARLGVNSSKNLY